MKKVAFAAVASLEGLGPKSSAALRSIGVETIEQLRSRDPFEVYAELNAKLPGTSLNFLYALIGAVEDIHWQEIKRSRRTAILLRAGGDGHYSEVTLFGRLIVRNALRLTARCPEIVRRGIF